MGTVTIDNWTGMLAGTAGDDYRLLSSGALFSSAHNRAGIDANVKALWRMDTDWTDASGRGNHGTLTNMDPASASPWAVLQMIQSKTSHLAFFGKDGRLVYAPWDRVRTQSWSVYDTTPFAIRFGMHTSHASRTCRLTLTRGRR